jgi:hypothetical protein
MRPAFARTLLTVAVLVWASGAAAVDMNPRLAPLAPLVEDPQAVVRFKE